MKKDNLNNLFVRGGKTALVALAAMPMIAYGKDTSTHDTDGIWGMAALGFVICMLAAPAIADKIKQNRRNKQR